MGRRKLVTGVGVGIVMAGAGVIAAGCFDSSGDCDETRTCDLLNAGVPAGCAPSQKGWAAEDRCGVFVRASGDSDDGAEGTAAAPLKTLGAAIKKAVMSGGRVYACAETFTEAIEVPGGVTVYGGLDCADKWQWVGERTKTTVVGPGDVVAVRIARGEVLPDPGQIPVADLARLDDVVVQAADAEKPGGSSIAVLVDRVSAALVRCELRAGNGADGAPGAPGAEPDVTGAIPRAAAGMGGNPGKGACSGSTMTVDGGAHVTNECGGGDVSIGGTGGNGLLTSGGDGDVGQVGPSGDGGAGEPESGGNWNCTTSLGDPDVGGGKPGASGEAGTAGPGAIGLGTITAGGYVGPSGGIGTPGKPGQGGGGGGGARGGNICGNGGNASGPGASGGSGGAGGCGGQPGRGGGAGGASIALSTLDASVMLEGCTLTAANGGRGGAGGASQPGGFGGVKGPGGAGAGNSKDACAGGVGGLGGDGGPGGGGLGGPSAAIAYAGAEVTKDEATTLGFGAAGVGGPGGNGNAEMNSGADGAAAPELKMQRSAAP